MEAKAVFRKNGFALYALCDQSRDLMMKVRDGRDTMVTWKTARNPGQHRLFFAILAKVVDSGAWNYDVESLLHWCKWKCGLVERYMVRDANYVRAQSIAFESMEQERFQRFFERAIWHICNEITGPGLRNEIIDIVDGPYRDLVQNQMGMAA